MQVKVKVKLRSNVQVEAWTRTRTFVQIQIKLRDVNVNAPGGTREGTMAERFNKGTFLYDLFTVKWQRITKHRKPSRAIKRGTLKAHIHDNCEKPRQTTAFATAMPATRTTTPDGIINMTPLWLLSTTKIRTTSDPVIAIRRIPRSLNLAAVQRLHCYPELWM